MQLYLPIAEISVNLFTLLLIGGGVGFISGLVGVGGGFLLTPLLFFVGVPPAVAVATGGNQVVGSSFSGALTHWRRKAVDVKMGLILLVGGTLGSAAGVVGFNTLRAYGQFELVVGLAYVVLLGGIGCLMLVESINALRKRRRPLSKAARKRPWAQRLPFRTRFRSSKLYISVIPPILIGFGIGFLGALLGVGGGFLLIPAMIYLLHMPTNVVVGTSLFQVTFSTAFATVLHASTGKTVDVLLAIILLVGGVIGAQIGAQFGGKMRGEHLRLLLAAIVLLVALKLVLGLMLEPDELFSLYPLPTRVAP